MRSVMNLQLGRFGDILAKPFGRGDRSERGMTLIEIIIVVALLGSLMAILVKNITDQADSARVDQSRIQMGNIAQSLQLYKVHMGRYPTTQQGLSALRESPGSKKWRGPYIDANQLRDPWDQDFAYESDGRNFKIISGGMGQQLGDDDDIYFPAEMDDDEAAPEE